ncbi:MULTISPECIES: hypothetical protein [Bradyrhizobium]|nr:MULTISPECIES: hypothetical protein [Bradyrhizobium]WLA75933.1 hypothetical protein QIH77_12335 [Bradyrhizobium diazoefficiens]BCE24773.1 hypothetical protein XF1B_74540 [Bradyrhizobium diazoefficiens]BCE51032.1 hypothetical protein XF4B_73810 [Bradyrhizobium diazoefficiens]BCF29474.1 hypothetical protein XF14B_74260 [Bradyrhizobium diazoefficiens]
MSDVSTIPVHLEGDHASSRFARRVRMRDVEDSSRKFSCENDSREVPRRKTFGIDEAAIRRIFYRYRDELRAGWVIRNSRWKPTQTLPLLSSNGSQYLAVDRNKKLQT